MCRYLFSILLLALLSCGPDEANRPVQILSDKSITPIEYAELSKILDYKVDYIPLETSKDCIVGEILSLSNFDDKLFIHSKLSNVERLSVFDSNGNFINTVGDCGRAQNEYLKIQTVIIDKINKNIMIIDPYKLKLLRYDFYGNYISSMDIDKRLKFANTIVQLSDGTYLVAFGIHFKERKNSLYAIYSSNFKPLNVVSSTSLHFNGEYKFSLSPLTFNGEEILCIEPLNNIIYSLSNDSEYVPKYEVTVLSDDKPISKGDYMQHFKLMARYISGVMVVQDYIIINYSGKSIMYNKKTGDGYLLSNNYDLSEFDKLPFIPNNIKLSDEKYSYSVLDYYTANTYYEEIKMIDDDFKKIVSGMNVNSNPILIRYHIH